MDMCPDSGFLYIHCHIFMNIFQPSMRVVLLLAGLVSCSLASATIYYVQDIAYNENASDSNPGTDINHPWATWQKAFNSAMPGDTVYFRGGTWYPRTDDYGNVTIYHPSSGYGTAGTRSKPVCFFAYPPDVATGNMPVLDCRHTHPTTNNHVGLYISTPGYVEFKGLSVTHVRSWPRASGEMWCAGIMANDFRHLTLERMTTSYIGGAGFFLMENDTLYLINCDSHHNCDSLDIELPGNDADGFTLLDGNPASDTFNIAYIRGCRAWNNSDDGFEISNSKQLDISHCWSWNNGYLEGDPNGFKFNYSHLQTPWKRKVNHCIAADNERAGFLDVNLHADMGPFMEFSNNTAFRCGVGFGSGKGQVFDCSLHPASVLYRNNISYAFTGPYPAAFKACDYGFPTYVIQDHNTWIQTGETFMTEDNPAYSVSVDDFVSLDTAQLRWPRKEDGSLPDISFLSLQSPSDLVNGGIDVGLAFYGPAPDLGARQLGSFFVELGSPREGKEIPLGETLLMQAMVKGAAEDIEEVSFYSDNLEQFLGTGFQLSHTMWEFSWEPEAVGTLALRAVARNSQGETATSSLVRVQIKHPLGTAIHTSKNEEMGTIIPNPNRGIFRMELEEPLDKHSEIHIISMMGRTVAIERMDRGEKVREFDLSSLSPGLYSIRLIHGGLRFSALHAMQFLKL
jgi:hypothetical protein